MEYSEQVLNAIDRIEKNIDKESILQYLDLAKKLMYQDQDLVRQVTEKLRLFILNWAKSNCNCNFDQIVEKKHLENKKDWYVEKLNNFSQSTRTSGSTTGVPFEYLRYFPVFEKIEWDYHYNFVLDEFEVCENPNILYMMPHNYLRENGKYIVCKNNKSELNIVNHGNKRNPIIHYVDFEAYKNDRENLFFNLFEYVKQNKIDVFYTSAPEINSMCSYMRKFNIQHKIGYLLSNTNERLLPQDVNYLIENNSFNYICDHMKCWDGGAGFFTCKHGTYHLMDELSWVESIDGKLISTDYFNLCSPFIKYWNGDLCRVGENYTRCLCGRLFRDFEFLENRPFSLKGTCIAEIKQKMKNLEIKGIKQVRCNVDFLEVISNKELTEDEKDSIRKITDKFNFRFTTE